MKGVNYMLPMKLNLTEELASELRHLRLSHPVNGEILTAEKLSKELGKNRAWVSQIESRRLKKIKREDVIKLYKLYYGYSDREDGAAESLAEFLLSKYYLDSEDTTFSQISNSEDDKPADIYFISKEYIKWLNSILSHKLDGLETEEDYNIFANFLYTLIFSISGNYTDTVTSISLLHFDLFKYATQTEHQEIMQLFNEISKKIDGFEPRRVINTFTERIHLLSNTTLLESEMHNHLLTGIVELTQIISCDYNIENNINFINCFIELTHKYFSKFHPEVPFTIKPLTSTENKSNLLNTITLLKTYLSNPSSLFNVK